MSNQEQKPSFPPLKNTTNTGQAWHFTYKEQETVVKDALGRETVYRFDKDHYFTSKVDALHQSMTMQYDSNGQLKEIVDVTGSSQSFCSFPSVLGGNA